MAWNKIEDNEFLKLSGMEYKSGYYSAEYWLNLTGIDPRVYPELIRITRTGLCVWTEKASRLCNKHFILVAQNWASLGINNR